MEALKNKRKNLQAFSSPLATTVEACVAMEGPTEQNSLEYRAKRAQRTALESPLNPQRNLCDPEMNFRGVHFQRFGGYLLPEHNLVHPD